MTYVSRSLIPPQVAGREPNPRYSSAAMTPGTRLGHFQIAEKIGEGGMGAVYRAVDTRLGREVAIKVLPEAVASNPERLERFQREARAIAALNHPNIVTIHSVEHIDGVHFLTMELVSGRPLDRLLEDGLLSIDRVMAISVAIAEALAAAHEKGVVHRDLKPANVAVTSTGRVKVLDFGLAKMQATGLSTGESATNLLTEAGTVMGTPAYMSPEQVSGRDVDHRSDIFSLGVLLYEMATGVRPFRGRTSAEVASAILRDDPAPVSDLRGSVPGHVSSVISRCLDKNVTTRVPSMAEIAQALQPAAATAKRATDEGPSIAVLPFQNLSADQENEFFGDGLAEDILNALAQVAGLRVAARTSSFTFKDRKTDLAAIGEKLRVATVLDGSVRRAGNRVRVTVQLVDIETGSTRWSERYDREMADIFEVQDEIAQTIAAKLKVALTEGGPTRLVRPGTKHVEAYDLYVRGRALLLKRGRHVDEAVTCFRRAVELDPAFVAAWSGLADCHTVRGYWGVAPPGDVMPKALTAARRAVSLDPNLAEVHTALALALLLWERDFDKSRTAFLRSLELNPNYLQGRCWYGLFQLQFVESRIPEGLAELKRALDADPLSSYACGLYALGLGTAGETAEGLELARRGVELDPDALLTQWVHGLAAHLHGALPEAMTAFQAAEAVSGSHPYAIGCATAAFADMGRMPEARATHARLVETASRRYVATSMLALSTAAIGEQDQALELVTQACDERDPYLIVLAGFPLFKRITQDPRFAEVRRRLGLPG